MCEQLLLIQADKRDKTGMIAVREARPATMRGKLHRGTCSREGLNELIAAKKSQLEPTWILPEYPSAWPWAGASKPDVSTVEAFKQVPAQGQNLPRPGTQRYLA